MGDLDKEILVGKLARLLKAEQENPTEEEMLAMGDTVLNRTGLAGYPDNPEEVLVQPNQYHPFNPENPRFQIMQKFGPQDPRWQEYIAYAERILDPERKRTDYTHYFTGEPPTWAGQLQGLTRIGAHWFGREKRKAKSTPVGRKKVEKE